MKEPKKEPVTIPGQEQLERISKKRRLKKLLEKQGILYGINVLDITIPPEEKEQLSTLNPVKLLLAPKTVGEAPKKRVNLVLALKDKEQKFTDYIAQQGGNEENLTQTTVKKASFFDRFVIAKDSSWKNAFDMVMLVASCYNVFTQAYYSAFGLPVGIVMNFLDYVIELLFFLDFVFCFCQEY